MRGPFQYRLFRLVLITIALFPSLAGQSYAAGPGTSQSPVSRFIDKPFYRAVESSHQLADRFQEQINGLLILPREMIHVWQQVAAGHSAGYPFLLLFQIFFVILSGIFLEFLLRRQLQPIYTAISSSSTAVTFISRLVHIGLGVALEALLLLCYVLLTFSLYVIVFPENGIAEIIAANYLLAGYYIRGLLFLITIFLSPSRPVLRILPFSDQVARFLFFWSFSLSSVEILLARSGIIMRKTGAEESVFLAVTGLIIISTMVMLAAMIMRSQKRVADSLCSAPDRHEISSLGCRLARNWQTAAFVLLFFVTSLWEIRVLDSGKIHFGKIIVALLAIPIFFSLDVWGRQLLRIVPAKSGEKADERGSLLEKIGSGKYVRHIQIAYRVLLSALLIFFFLDLFKIDVAIGRMFTTGVLTSIFIVIFVYLVWQFFTGWVDQKIQEEMPNDDEDADEGGTGGSRRGTLLLLLRKFTLVVLIVIAAMLIFSALGLNIAPLIAGAGILGLAISFGAQSLVTDIFAGIFFMIDDAFRVGDYIDTGSAKGMVEQISLRAVRLRHHRGMVQTVPFGKIGTVVNFSRDYIIMKLDFRVRYDTDVDKVRKIVKKIYKSLLEDEELGPKLLGKLKSQGVRQLDDSAMIMRIKFTTAPGEQFIMRKEILRRLQEAFRENNIEFAHRNVTVYMPSEEEKSKNQPAPDPRIQGAATAAILNQEEQAADEKGDNVEDTSF